MRRVMSMGRLARLETAIASRATSLPITSTLLVLAAVFATGLLSSILATRAAAASPLLASLKTE